MDDKNENKGILKATECILSPFDPGEPFDAMAESFRRQVVYMALKSFDAAVWRDMDGLKQIECFICGVVVGLICTCFSGIDPEGRDEMMKSIAEYLPQARLNAEAIVDGVMEQNEIG